MFALSLHCDIVASMLLNYASSHISQGDGDGDAVGDAYEERLFTDNRLEMKHLRGDVADAASCKEALLSQATGRKADYYSVPNVNAKKREQVQ